MLEIQYLTFDNALHAFKKDLMINHHEVGVGQYYINHKRYAIMDIDGEQWLVTFKREFFMTFGEFFPQDKDKVGETINAKHLREALGHTNGKLAGLIFLYEDGRRYYGRLRDLASHWYERKTYAEGKPVFSWGRKNMEAWK